MKSITINQAMKKAVSFFSSLNLGDLEKIETFTYWREDAPIGRYVSVTFDVTFTALIDREERSYLLTVSPDGCFIENEDGDEIARSDK